MNNISKVTIKNFASKYFVSLFLLLLFAFLILFIIFQNYPSVIDTFKLMITKKPERVTELYFTNYSAIPKRLQANHLYEVDFTTTNHEYRRKSYTYKAIMIEGNFKKTISLKKFVLRNNQSVQQQIQFTPTMPNSQIKIIIKLLNSQQEIRFRATT